MDSKDSATIVERLSDFLSKLTPTTAAKLVQGLERERLCGANGLPYDLIMSSIRPILTANARERIGPPTPLRQFCTPFEDLLVDDYDETSRTRQIRRSSILPVWNWLEEDLLTDTLPDITRRLAALTLGEEDVARSGTLAVMHGACSAAILSEVAAVRRDAGERRKLERRLGGEHVVDDAVEMARALSVATFILAVREALPKKIREFDDAMAAEVGDIYEEARHASMENGIYVPFSVMSRLDEPWQILRLARKLAGYGNDAAVSRSGLSDLAEVFVLELEDIADKLGNQRVGTVDLDEMLGEVLRFARISQGFIHEIDIRRYSSWGHRILSARGRLSATIAEEMSRFEQMLARALPLHLVGNYGKNGPRRPDITKAPNFDRAEKAAACLRFLTGVQPAAESIGTQSHCKTVMQEIETYLASYEDGLIEELRRSKGAEQANGLAFLDIVVGYRETMGAGEFARTLRRRGQVASAARAS